MDQYIICGDFRLTVNQASHDVVETYPMPLIKDLYAKLAGGKKFTKLDMSQAYLELPLDEESKSLVTINTQKEPFRYTRLPFRVSSSPVIFQRTIDNVLQGLNGVSAYLDDILVTGSTEKEHLLNFEAVLQRLKDAGLRLKQSKCVFLAQEVKHLGYSIDAQGLHPLNEKLELLKRPELQTT